MVFRQLNTLLMGQRRLYMFVTCVAVVSLLPILWLSSEFAGYFAPCLTPEPQRDLLRQTILRTCQLLDHHNIPYWLDYGTLLGAEWFGDVMPWDQDCDISYWSAHGGAMEDILSPGADQNGTNLHGNAMTVIMNENPHGFCDLYRWERDGNGGVYYDMSQSQRESLSERIFTAARGLNPPESMFDDLVHVDFAGGKCRVPREHTRVLAEYRYPGSFKDGPLPWRWRCHLPTWAGGMTSQELWEIANATSRAKALAASLPSP